MVNWLNTRIILALITIHDLDTRLMVFVLAFPQAELDVEVYVDLPYGFTYDSKAPVELRLKKNLYGLKQAANN